MFKKLPEKDQDYSIISFDPIGYEDVIEAIEEAEEYYEQYEREYSVAKKEEEESDDQIGYAEHITSKLHSKAHKARIRAILFSAMFIEGSINFWGVVVTGETFFRTHIERNKL